MCRIQFVARAARIFDQSWQRATHNEASLEFLANSKTNLCASLALVAVFALSAPARAQTWTGTASTDWNNAANWANPNQIPNSPTADVLFAPSNRSNVSIPAVFSVRSLSFASGTNSYELGIPLVIGNKWLTGLETITVAESVTTTQSIGLGGDATGSLLFTGSGPAALTIANNALPTAVATPTLLIGPFTTLGTSGTGGITVTGTGTTTISGAFATSAAPSNNVVGGLTKSGTGTLTLSGSGADLIGGLTLAGGTLRLDYSTNTSSKLGSGSLKSSGGDLILVRNVSTAITQNLTNTDLTAGHTEINATPTGASATLGLASITRFTGATLNLSGSLNTTTSTGNTRGLLGSSGAAFATFGGQFWAAASGSTIVPILGSLDSFGPGINTDVAFSNVLGQSLTTNSLRFTNTGLTLFNSGTLTLQSAGILLPSNVATATITGGILDSVIAHVYGSDLTIGSRIVAANGITKTGPGTLTLGGNNAELNGPVNVNRGGLRFISVPAMISLSEINFNDARTGSALQTLTVDVGDNSVAATSAAIRLSAYSDPGATEANIFTTGTSQSSRVTLVGVIASAPGAVTPLRLTGEVDDTSGFNLTGVNTFTGTVTLGEGTLGINSNASLGNPANALIMSPANAEAGGLEFLNGGIDLARSVRIDGNTRVISNGTDVNTISGPITGGGSQTLVKAGTGTLVLTNAGNAGYTGRWAIEGGTLRVSAGALGTTGNLSLSDGATLAVTGNNTLVSSRSFALGSVPGPATANIDVAANQSFTVAGVVANGIGSAGTLLKTGPGTLALTQPANQYTGGTIVRGGTLLVATEGSLGAAATPVAVEVAGLLTYTGSASTARSFSLNGGRLGVVAGQGITFANASVAGGFLVGPGAYATQVGTANTFIGNTSFTASSLFLSGADTLTAFTNGGALEITPDTTATLAQFTNSSSGRMAINGTANVSEFVSNGQVNIPNGGVVNNSLGPLVLGGGSRMFIGTAAVHGGTLNLGGRTLELNGGLLVNNGTISGVTNVNYGSLAMGSGNFGVVNVNQGGVYSPGNSPGISSAESVAFENVSLASGAPRLAIEIGGTMLGTQYDQLHVTGALSLAGVLDVSLINGFTPTAGNTFQILDWGSLNGTFATLDLPPLAAGRSWDTSLLYNTGVLKVIGFNLPGDYNGDGTVNAADYTVWRDNLGTNFGLNGNGNEMDGSAGIVDAADYAWWKQHFGNTRPDDGGAAKQRTTVPEPSSMALVLLVVVHFGFGRRLMK